MHFQGMCGQYSTEIKHKVEQIILNAHSELIGWTH